MVPIKRFITYIMANVSKLHSLRYTRLLTQFYDTYCVSVCEQMDLMKYALYSLRLYLITCMISMTLLFSYTSKPLYQVFETMFNTVFIHVIHFGDIATNTNYILYIEFLYSLLCKISNYNNVLIIMIIFRINYHIFDRFQQMKYMIYDNRY